jgi:carboxylesterase
MRLVGDYLHEGGFTVSGPLLPGHGTVVEDMNRCQWTDWVEHVEGALASLKARCETVFVGGLSMGSLLTLYLTAGHSGLPGAIVYSPAVIVRDRLIFLTPLLKYLLRKRPKSDDSDGDLTDPDAPLRLWNYEEYPIPALHEFLKLIHRVRRLLPRVTCPLLVIHSTRDRTIHPNSARFTYERVGSEDKDLVTLHNSGHGLTVDSEWESVAERTYQFILRHLSAEPGNLADS